MTISNILQTLRQTMTAAGIAMVVVPTDDPHLSEYVCDHFGLRAYLSGFTGSAGTLVVGLDWAGLWTDGRYHLQAQTQLQGSGITLYPAGKPKVETVHQMLQKRLAPGQVLALDGRTISKTQGDVFAKTAKKTGAILRLDWMCPQAVWPDRPLLPQAPVYTIDNAGQLAGEKLQTLRTAMAEEHGHACLLTALDDIAWMLNLRGDDLDCTPVFLSYLWITKTEATLFVENSKLSLAVEAYLAELGVTIAPYDSAESHCANWKKGAVLVEEGQCNARLYQLLQDHAKAWQSPVARWKAMKTESEIENLRQAHLQDAVAMVTFLHWLENTKEPLDEVGVADYLDNQRRAQPGNLGLSFPTICGYGSNGAIIHYSAQKETCATVEPEGLLLVDSGGQYATGTTDITRTIALGALTDDMRRHYTLVLQGHLALLQAVFPVGTTGAALDVLARTPLWNQGLDYLHGTGHGVGYRLSVHEGPQSISHQRKNGPALEVGMVTSNEPGYYRDGHYGIRLENLMVCVASELDGFLKFEPLSLVPFDKNALDLSLLTPLDCQRLDAYHQAVYASVAPLLPPDLQLWLWEKTCPVDSFNKMDKVTGK